MKNKLVDLNNILFAQLERLNDEDLQGQDLKEEIERSKAIANISKNLIMNARVALDAQIHKDSLTFEYANNMTKMPEMLDSKIEVDDN